METKGRSLEETAALFDGEEAENTLHDAATAAVAPTHHDNASVEKDSHSVQNHDSIAYQK